MRQKKSVSLLVILTLLIIVLYGNAKENGRITYIDIAHAEVTDYSLEEFWKQPLFEQIQKSLFYYSDLGKQLRVCIKDRRKTLTVQWETLESSQSLPADTYDTYNFVRWRPGSYSFIYSQYEEDDDGGDIPTCSIYYVDLKKENGHLKLSKKTILSKHFDTDFVWSSDGKFFAYVDGLSLIIQNYDSGETWVTSRIIGPKNICLYPGMVIEALKWIDNEQKIILLYKETPSQEQVFLVQVDLKQFTLQ